MAQKVLHCSDTCIFVCSMATKVAIARRTDSSVYPVLVGTPVRSSTITIREVAAAIQYGPFFLLGIYIPVGTVQYFSPASISAQVCRLTSGQHPPWVSTLHETVRVAGALPHTADTSQRASRPQPAPSLSPSILRDHHPSSRCCSSCFANSEATSAISSCRRSPERIVSRPLRENLMR